jgi:hypothetical protein
MNAAAILPVGSFLRHAEEEYRSGHLFEDVGEVFRPHQRMGHAVPSFRAAQFRGHGLTQRDRAGIVQRDGETVGEGRFRLAAMGGGGAVRHLQDRLANGGAALGRKGADRAAQQGRVGDDVVGGAGIHPRDGDDARLGGGETARDHGLQRSDDGGGGGHRVARVVRHGGVAAAPFHQDVELVGRRHHGTGLARHHAVRRVGHDVQGEGGIGQRVEQPVFDHEARAVKALLARLKHEAHLARQVALPRRQDARRARQHGGVRVVAAGMHPSRNGGRERKTRFLLHGQCVHVAAQQNRTARLAAFQRRHRARRRGALPPFQRQVGQFLAHLGESERRFQPKFGFGVNGAAEGGDAGFDLPCGVEHGLGEHGGILTAPAASFQRLSAGGNSL